MVYQQIHKKLNLELSLRLMKILFLLKYIVQRESLKFPIFQFHYMKKQSHIQSLYHYFYFQKG